MNIFADMERTMMSLEESHQPAGAVILERMPQQAEVRSVEDDWTGSTDAVERRKRQNRLHQRLYRKRQKELKTKNSSSPDSVVDELQPNLGEPDPHLSALLQAGNTVKQLELLPPVQAHPSQYQNHILTPNITRKQAQDVIKQVDDYLSQQLNSIIPRADLLLTLVQFNVFRALFSNMITLDLGLDWLTGDAISTFFQPQNPPSPGNYPSSLRPTALQRQVSHHPYVDLFPFPELRDNLLGQGEDFDDDDLCYDLVETCHAPSERSGLIVWGSPWDPASWEVTVEFAMKWPWMLRGCYGLLVSTNYWRGVRGEEELWFDTTPS